MSPPSAYPSDSWYHYDDETCDYGCMVTEYFYWALTSILGAQDYPGRAEEISNEWEANTRALVQSKDPDVYSLLTDSAYNLLNILPNGIYSPTSPGEVPGDDNSPDEGNLPEEGEVPEDGFVQIVLVDNPKSVACFGHGDQARLGAEVEVFVGNDRGGRVRQGSCDRLACSLPVSTPTSTPPLHIM